MTQGDRLRKISNAFQLLPKGTIVYLPEDDWDFIEYMCKLNSLKLYGHSVPFSGKNGGILFRGHECFMLNERDFVLGGT